MRGKPPAEVSFPGLVIGPDNHQDNHRDRDYRIHEPSEKVVSSDQCDDSDDSEALEDGTSSEDHGEYDPDDEHHDGDEGSGGQRRDSGVTDEVHDYGLDDDVADDRYGNDQKQGADESSRERHEESAIALRFDDFLLFNQKASLQPAVGESAIKMVRGPEGPLG